MKPILVFASVRIAVALIIARLLPLHDGRPANAGFLDLSLYNGAGLADTSIWRVPNPLYAVLVRLFDYSQERMNEWGHISLSMSLNIILTGLFVIIASKVLEKRKALLYAFVLGAHPYLALYSLKIDTSVFAFLPIALVTARSLAQFRSGWTLAIIAISSLLRNALIPMGWLYVMTRRCRLTSVTTLVGVFILAISSMLQIKYGADYLSQNYGCYSLSKIVAWFEGAGWQQSGAAIAGIIVTPVLHLLLDLGAREAVANHCLLLPREMARQLWIHLSVTFFLTVAHGWLMFRMLRRAFELELKNQSGIDLLLPLTVLIPTLYGSAHMRYLIPLIPLLLLCAFEPVKQGARLN